MGLSVLCSICDEPRTEKLLSAMGHFVLSNKFDASYAAASNICPFL